MLGFLRDFRQRHSRLFDGIRGLINYDYREKMLWRAMTYVRSEEIEGDYMEFGVYDGNTFVPAYHLGRRFNPDMRFLGFDSFAGLPELEGKDKGGSFQEGEYAYSLPRFKKKLRDKKVDLSRVQLIKGWFAEVLDDALSAKLDTEKAAVIWIDCDLYLSTVPVLDFIVPYLQSGTILCFDDWFCFRGDPADKGEQRAVSEWLAGHKISLIEYHKFGCFGNSFIVKKV
jgi:hypothetical protein